MTPPPDSLASRAGEDAGAAPRAPPADPAARPCADLPDAPLAMPEQDLGTARRHKAALRAALAASGAAPAPLAQS